MHLNRLTVLVGGNNSGKTSFLEALFAALGPSRRALTEQDIYLAKGEVKPPQDREINVDVLVKPVDNGGQALDDFPQGSYWTNLWGTGISQDDEDRDFMAFRTTLQWSGVKGEYETDRRFLSDWPGALADMHKATVKDQSGIVSATQVEPIALNYMDAKRDIDDDLRRQGSFWRRLTSDLGLDEKSIEQFEALLSKLNEQIIDKSTVLKHLKETLGLLEHVVGSEKSGIEIAPIARRLRDLSKGVDVNFATEGAQTFPLSRHGMGTRSLAALLVFRAYMSWRVKQKQGDPLHPFLALEEPEAHLHPQAQRALFEEINAIPGQLIVSTHSPYFAGQASVRDLRHFQKNKADTTIAQIDLTGLGGDDVRKLERAVINTRGDALYARALVLYEGTETEDQCFPIFAEAFWGANVHKLGFTFIGVGGFGNYLPFLRLAKSLNIPWYIFSDGEDQAIKSVVAAGKAIGIADLSKASNVSIIPNKMTFENYILSEGYRAEIEKAIVEADKGSAIDDFIKLMHGQLKKGGAKRDYQSAGGRDRAIVDMLLQDKARYAKPLARAIVAMKDPGKRFPKALDQLFNTMAKDLSLPKAKEK
jgi:putative ATP-dependent endonuclease of OLD family